MQGKVSTLESCRVMEISNLVYMYVGIRAKFFEESIKPDGTSKARGGGGETSMYRELIVDFRGSKMWF